MMYTVYRLVFALLLSFLLFLSLVAAQGTTALTSRSQSQSNVRTFDKPSGTAIPGPENTNSTSYDGPSHTDNTTCSAWTTTISGVSAVTSGCEKGENDDNKEGDKHGDEYGDKNGNGMLHSPLPFCLLFESRSYYFVSSSECSSTD